MLVESWRICACMRACVYICVCDLINILIIMGIEGAEHFCASVLLFHTLLLFFLVKEG